MKPTRGDAFQLWSLLRPVALTEAVPRQDFSYWYADDSTLAFRTTLVSAAGDLLRGQPVSGSGPRIPVSDRIALTREEV